MNHFTLAIDPGYTESAYVVLDNDTKKPIEFAKVPNAQLRDSILPFWLAKGFSGCDECTIAVEMVASYGMPVGEEVFETVVWIGRFVERVRLSTGAEPVRVKRNPVKVHHCHAANATDANISQALKDRFALGVRNHGKGTKDAPGWFYGFSKDVWQAYALAVYVADVGPAVKAVA